MSRYEELETFVRIVEAGSITAAAKQLHVAKSAVSRRLKELEARLGTQLITRSTRQLTLTDSGRALYERGTSLLADWSEIEAVIQDAHCELSGTIRIAAPLSFGLAHLSPALIDFSQAHPDLGFDIDFNDRQIDLIAEGMDLAIRIGNLPDSNLIARKIAPIRFAAFASPDYLKRHGTPQSIEDLKAHTEIRYGNRRTTGWPYTLPNGDTGRVEMQSQICATNGDFIRDAAMAGLGLAIEPRFIVYQQLRAGDLVEILPDVRWPELNAYAVYPPTRHLSQRVRRFVDFLVERFKGTPYWDS